MELIEQKMNEYFNWLKQSYKYKKMDSSTEITTPFRNHLNDYIRIYVDFLPDKSIILSDDGLTLNELKMANINTKTKARNRIIQSILNQFNLSLKDDEIIAHVKNESFAQSKHDLIQGILKIYDLTITSKNNVSSLFYEDVFNFLYEEELAGTAEVSVSGESGIKYSIDYILPETKSKPEKLINFANNLDFNKVTNDVYMYRDVKTNRPSRNNQTPRMFIIANDVDHPINDKARYAAEHENLLILHWSDKEKIISTLTT
ncbi:Domain of uncharacterised function DUF1828 [Staphylococcus petrasii]|uniref:DUF1828 domain-containing protein n=1 Tax=Staphylococcus petrasii TaxID=1276936 RepID=A0A380G346_9STAP|nr:DUF1828 domain-containing protein [Staphylococcus petrasii]PNZ31308.1 hypothetical protein CD137_03375 [Staphylococcus petrasii]TGE11698.1 DUF1828 domain-containing protein [Staphylococcus petrasii]TGE17747.1 DUF1828 domain-containing protein [Staphylococcus petrasii]SUM44658.1 Domain of uncharacterised function DUF1828 [Staphylococcus petrasii]